MRRWLVVFLTSLLLLLGGCSFLDDAKGTLTYMNEVSDYLTIASDFANQAPELAQQAVSDLQAAEDLVSLFQDMEQHIESFNELLPPDFASELHQQLVEQNNLIAAEIESYLNQIKDGLLDPAVLENNELFQSIDEVSNIIDQIQQIGQ